MNCNRECFNEKWTGNNIGDEGASKISESLMVNTALTRLDLSRIWNTTDCRKMNWSKVYITMNDKQWTILEMKEHAR